MAQGMASAIADIRDYEMVRACMAAFRPEVVIHMAAQPLVRLSYSEPVATYATNVMGTVHVLESARQCGTVRAVVNVTSDKCYENREWVWGYREDEPMGGFDPYSNSKGCSELVTSAYRRSFMQKNGIALASARAGNVIGGGDWAADRLVPDILRAFDRGEPVISATRMLRVPGSTCWSRCRATCCWRSGCTNMDRPMPRAGISAHRTRMPGQCSGSSGGWSSAGAMACAGSSMAVSIRTRRIT